MDDFSEKILRMAAEEQAKQHSSLCDRFGHPVYPVGAEEIICPRCDEKFISGERRMNPKSMSLEEFSKLTKTKILGSEEKPTSFSNTIQTEEIV